MQNGDIGAAFLDEFEPVRLDLLVTGLHGSIEDVQEMPDDPRLLCILRVNDDIVGRLTLDRAAAPNARLCVLADFAQALVLDKIRVAGESVLWPECVTAGHGHPMWATTSADRAVWACPADAAVTVAIGELGSARTT